jgi:hypothetical protein
MQRFFCVMAAVLMLALCAAGQQTAATVAGKAAHIKDGHPDLSGGWAFTIDLPPGAVKKVVNGSVAINKVDRGLAVPQRSSRTHCLTPRRLPTSRSSGQSQKPVRQRK